MATKKARPRSLHIPTIKLIGLNQLLLHEFSDGTIECIHQRMDMATRRVIPHQLYFTMREPTKPLTPYDLLFIGAAELVATELGVDYELPF
jgi:hypothetical protein